MRLSELQMIKLLPQWMREDDADSALAEAIDKLIKKHARKIKTLRTWDQIDNLTNEELDELAWELNVDWYRTDFEIDRKRATIKQAAAIMAKRGTKWAVERLVETAFGLGEVTEWYEYGGRPYCFKVTTNATLTRDGMQMFLSMIERVKSARSHIDTIETVRQTRHTIYCGVCAFSTPHNVILDDFQTEESVEMQMVVGSAPRIPYMIQKVHDSYHEEKTGESKGYPGGYVTQYNKNIIKED